MSKLPQTLVITVFHFIFIVRLSIFILGVILITLFTYKHIIPLENLWTAEPLWTTESLARWSSITFFLYTLYRNCMTFSILACRVPPERSAHGAVVYNLKLWVFAGYDGSKRSAFNHVLANQVFW